MREICMLRAMWRVLETGLRTLLNGHEDGNVGYSQGVSYGLPRQRPTLPGGPTRCPITSHTATMKEPIEDAMSKSSVSCVSFVLQAPSRRYTPRLLVRGDLHRYAETI